MADIPAFITREDYQKLVEIFDDVIGDEPAKVLVFGSRATGNHKPESDLDLVLFQDETFAKQAIIEPLRESIRQANLSVAVEIFEQKEVTAYTEKRIQNEGQVFWENTNEQKAG